MEEYDIDMDFDIGMEVQERHYTERINFDAEGLAHKEKFRLTQEMVDYIEYRIGEDLRHATSRSHALSPRQQIHLCLRFLSGNAFYHINGDALGVHKSSVCRAIHSVVAAINETLLSEFVHFPTNAAGVQQQFFAMSGMPNVCGVPVMDGTLIKIQAPKENEHQYVDRHGNHSINALFVCGPDLDFYFCSAQYPGSVHDARVLRNSALQQIYDIGWRPSPFGYLLGDSAYPCHDWLIPHVRFPVTEAERNFNIAHKSTRSVIERSFGVLKQRFSVLNTPLRVKSPQFACEIVKACSVLHNMCIRFMPLPLDIPEFHDGDNIPEENVQNEENIQGRQHLINYFANL